MNAPAKWFCQGKLAVMVLAAFLTACGGGDEPAAGSIDDGSRIEVTPKFKVAFAPNQLNFTWSPVGGASYYRLLENPDGVSGYHQIGPDLKTTHYEHPVSLYLRVNARYMLEICNYAGCVTLPDEIFLGQALTGAIAYLKASNSDAQDRFGISVALNAGGDVLAVGAVGEASGAIGPGGDQQDGGAPFAGAVYLFRHGPGGWQQTAYLKASNTEQGDFFGYAVALSDDGTTVAVSAINERSLATGINGDQGNDGNNATGAVYIFVEGNAGWSQQAYVKASNTGVDLFGAPVLLSGDGDTLAVGAHMEASNAKGINGDQGNNDAVGAGAVYLYGRDQGAWTQQAYIKASNSGALDKFGKAAAISRDGNTLAVGAPWESSDAVGIDGSQDNDNALLSGAVYLFGRSGGNWTQQAYLKASNADIGDMFGWSVALSGDGNTLAVGAVHEASAAEGVGGDQSSDDVEYAGAVYLFGRQGGGWSQEHYIKASNTGPGDYFGWYVALDDSGSTLAVVSRDEASAAIGLNGEQRNDNAKESGAVYIYQQLAGEWSPRAYLKASNTEKGDHFGSAISLSADGYHVAVGALGESSAAVGLDGDQGDNSAPDAGAVYLF